MAQISIPMSNKVGYSMFWGSMWDNKINYDRGLKEDIYLNQFVPLIFEDSISTKIFKTVNFSTLDIKRLNKLYSLHVKLDNLKKNDFYKYLLELNKVNFFKSKIWLLKYQKWVIIYFFIYLPTFNDLKNKPLSSSDINHSTNQNSINKLYSLYKITNIKLKYSYKFFSNNVDKNYF